MKINPYIGDLIGFAGIACASYGAWLYSQPLGYMVGGSFLIICALAYAFENRPKT